jgi:hypothetical protein
LTFTRAERSIASACLIFVPGTGVSFITFTE